MSIYDTIKAALIERGWKIDSLVVERQDGEVHEFIHPDTNKKYAWIDAINEELAREHRNMLSIAHISDNHSRLVPLEECDLVVSSGDFLPNISRGNRSIEKKFQLEWIENNLDQIKSWLGGRPIIASDGNHDFTSLCDALQKHGIEAYDATNKIISYKGYNFYGFPWINYIAGEWNYECQILELDKHIRRLKDVLSENRIDVLIAHAPMANLLDLDETGSRHYGLTLMSNLFMYGLDEKHWPKLYCCGHCHHSGGKIAHLNPMVVSNAATTVNMLTLPAR